MAESRTPRVTVVENGPYRVTGARLVRVRPIYDADGNGIEWQWGKEIEVGETYDLCRCGRSAYLPFCDGTERERDIGFDGTEVADRRPTAERRRPTGEEPFVLTDDRKLCSHMVFCESVRGNAWALARIAGEDLDVGEYLAAMIRRCPSGRLQRHVTADGEPIEEELEPVIGVVENGPLWLRGRIPIESADGFTYEVRNRMTLCRCGQSNNKPLCDGTHWKVEFTDPWPADERTESVPS